MKFLKLLSLFFLLGLAISCSDDDEMSTPVKEEESSDEEIINRVTLTFTPEGSSGEAVTSVWFDADGDGAETPTIQAINLEEGVEYEMSMKLENTLADPDEDITAEIRKEDDEHQFFFEFTNNIFSNPSGNGNIDNKDDPVNYNDKDENNLPVGLSTQWTAGVHTDSSGSFRVILKHQPGSKNENSNSTTGGTDLDITFALNIKEDANEEEEAITKVVLTFAPTAGGDTVTAEWFDADGEGVGNPVRDDIELAQNTEYDMSITLTNTLADPDEDITAEIRQEDDEHQFFFSFNEFIFSNPSGDGNVDNKDDPVNYNDKDENNLPVGLSTRWTTETSTVAVLNGFRMILKHQPGTKSATSDSNTGSTDIDIVLTVVLK